MSKHQDSTVTIVKWVIGGFVVVVAIALGYNIYIDGKQNSVVFQNRKNDFPQPSITPSPIPPAYNNNIFDQIAGEYISVFENQTLVEMKTSGIESIKVNWTLTAQGTFETKGKVILNNGFEQNIRTSGNTILEEGKVVFEVKNLTVNGVSTPISGSRQTYTISSDRKELKSDDSGVKLVKQ